MFYLFKWSDNYYICDDLKPDMEQTKNSDYLYVLFHSPVNYYEVKKGTLLGFCKDELIYKNRSLKKVKERAMLEVL